MVPADRTAWNPASRPRAPGSIPASARSGSWKYDRYRYRAVPTMRGSATELADEVPTTLGAVEPVDEASCLLRTGSDSLDRPAVWAATFGSGFVVREPPEPVERLRTPNGAASASSRSAPADRPVRVGHPVSAVRTRVPVRRFVVSALCNDPGGPGGARAPWCRRRAPAHERNGRT